MQVPPGYAMFIPSAIRRAVGVPVVGVGRFKDPRQAERALQEGLCDLVGVVRGQIADPDFGAKARAGHAGDIRTCLSCNQECVGRMGLNRWLGCIENPRTGLESTPLPSIRRRRRLVVVGGGPGGLQAAVTAAERGHRVVLFERHDRLGGQVQVAASVPSRAEFLDITRNLIVAAHREGVELQDRDQRRAPRPSRAEQPDAVIIATGARPSRPWWAGDHPGWSTSGMFSKGRAHPEGDVVVVDELGFHQATSTAEWLADRGCRVEIVTNAMVVGQDLGVTLDLETWNVKAEAKGIGQSVDLVPMGVRGRRRDGNRRGRPRDATPPHRLDAAAGHRLGGLCRPPAARGRAVALPQGRPDPRAPGRGLPGPAPGPCRGHRGSPGGGVVVTGRDRRPVWVRRWRRGGAGGTAAGRSRKPPSRKPAGRPSWSGRGPRTGRGPCSAGHRALWSETGPGLEPARLAATLAGVVEPRAAGRPAGLARRPRPRPPAGRRPRPAAGGRGHRRPVGARTGTGR